MQSVIKSRAGNSARVSQRKKSSLTFTNSRWKTVASLSSADKTSEVFSMLSGFRNAVSIVRYFGIGV